MTTSTTELDKRNEALQASRAVIERFTDEKRNATADERELMRKAHADFDRHQVRYEEARRLEDEASIATPLDLPTETRADTATGDELRNWANGEGDHSRKIDLHEAHRDYQAGRLELRVLNSGETSQGAGNTIPTTFGEMLYVIREQISGFRKTMPTHLMTMTGEPLRLPREVGEGTAERVLSQGTTYDGDDPTFDRVSLGSNKYGAQVRVSKELLRDTSINLTDYLARNLGRRLTKLTETDYITGSGGGGQSTGIGGAGALDTAVTGAAASGGAFTFDNLIDLKYAIDADYLMGSCWLTNHATLGAIAKLKDSDGQYLWQPSRQIGEPDMLLGFPVYTSPGVQEVGLNQKSVFFGNFTEAVVLRDVGTMEIARSDERYFETDEVAFKANCYTDTAILRDDAAQAFLGGPAA